MRGRDPATTGRASAAARVRAEGAYRRARDGATQFGRNFSGKGVHEASRIAGLAEGSEIISSKNTAAGSRFPVSELRTVKLRGTSEPIDVVTVEWR